MKAALEVGPLGQDAACMKLLLPERGLDLSKAMSKKDAEEPEVEVDDVSGEGGGGRAGELAGGACHHWARVRIMLLQAPKHTLARLCVQPEDSFLGEISNAGDLADGLSDMFELVGITDAF
jgi:hypothetical protein